MICCCNGFSRRQFFVEGQRLPDDLVHVVIPIGGEAADEMNIRPAQRELAILRINRGILRARDWIIRIALGARIFADDAGLGVLLAG
jgi:hypothetical protein